LSQLRPSLFPNLPPFINFLTPTQKYEKFVRLEIPWNLWTACHNPLLLRCMLRAGFQPRQITEATYKNLKGAVWDSIDSRTRFLMLCKITDSPQKATALLAESAKSKDLLKMNKELKINRMPGLLSICRKDELAKKHARFNQRFGQQEFDFVPETYSIPSDREKLVERMAQAQIPEKSNLRGAGGVMKPSLWIVKPCIRSGGEGIHLIDNMLDIPNTDPTLKDVDQAIVQKYIDNPLLVRGLKFDMRIYVLVTSIDPLVIYVYQDGLARFASEPYNTNSLEIRNNCIHLTNSKINKENTESYGSKEDLHNGFLWTLTMLKNLFEKEGLHWASIWANVEDVVLKTILLGYKDCLRDCEDLGSSYNCFKLLGFDVMLDENLKPWVLEVNTDPCLFADPIDNNLKGAMIAEMFNIVGFQIPKVIAKF